MTTTFEWLRTTLARDYKLALEQITPDAMLEDLGLDSLAVAELMFNVEDAFGITLPPDPVPLVRVVDVVAYIDALVRNRPDAKAVVASPTGQPRSC